ncbi:uncharacterized protein N7496_010736 [Penicillium cataractarum]|uniref:Anaphase-promoting complex subunit 4 WD40 domain-containing protein n=1 Tax=Penicillium cataractarum TaxID=2100454 RepID=A0A9W9RDP2_9EURO|nr:uncharacterized protein N7496_010736 [Penicillium cataractarum]KAJ5358323.1 hypothetical protein N7496_010736 [Penicillium cataractarum]
MTKRTIVALIHHNVALSRDSKLLASGSVDETIKLWDTSSGKCLWTLEANSSLVSQVTFSRDSRLPRLGFSQFHIRKLSAITDQDLEVV